MYSFLLRPKWILFHLVVLSAIVGMLAASNWQWNKYNARADFVTTVQTRQDRDKTPPVPLTSLLSKGSGSESELAAIEYRIATATGSYLPTGQLLQINRTQDGVNGVNLLSPFQIDGGPIVIVNRGFIPDRVQPPPPPTGTVIVGGTVRISQQRRTGELTDNAAGDSSEVRRVDLPLVAERLGIQIAPVYLEFIASDPAAERPPIPVPAPDLTGGPPHLSYTIQWLVFSGCVAIGWVFAVRRSLRTHRRNGVGRPGAPISADAEPRARPSA